MENHCALHPFSWSNCLLQFSTSDNDIGIARGQHIMLQYHNIISTAGLRHTALSPNTKFVENCRGIHLSAQSQFTR